MFVLILCKPWLLGGAILSGNKFSSCGSGFQPRSGRGKMPLPHKMG